MESNNNILESLPEDQQLQVYELMGIANIEDGNVAAKLYIESNHDINRAVQRWFDRQSGAMHEEPAFPQEQQIPGMAQNQQARPQRNQEPEVQTQYRRHLQKKQREEEEKGISDSIKTGVTSVMSGFKNMWNSFVPIAIRGETVGGEQFTSYFNRNHSDLVKNIKFNLGTFEENVEEATKMKRPLLVYLHVDGAAFKTIPNIFKNKKLVEFMNNKFRILGILMNTEESQKITKYVETKDCPCLAVFRVNLLDETNLLEFIPLTNETNADQVLERLQNIERSYFMILADEEKVKQDTKRAVTQQQIRNFQMNNPFFYAGGNQEDFPPGQMFGFFAGNQQQQQRPQISQEEQARLEEARILRQIQEEEFKEVERKIMEAQTKQVEEEKTKKEKEESDRIAKEKREEDERIKEQQKALHRKFKTEALPEEPAEGAPDAVLVIFRLPDGNRLERRFRNTDKVQSLYDFVDTKEVQFDSSTVRYDLMQPRPFLCLEEKEKSIAEYFEGSNHEVIHVRELTA